MKEQRSSWLYALAGVVLVGVFCLALLSHLWYQIVVLSALIALFVFLVLKTKRLEEKLDQFIKKDQDEKVELDHEHEKKQKNMILLRYKKKNINYKSLIWIELNCLKNY